MEKYGYGARLQGLRALGSQDTPAWECPVSSSPTRQVALAPPQPTSIGKEYETASAHVAQVSSMTLDSVDATNVSRISYI